MDRRQIARWNSPPIANRSSLISQPMHEDRQRSFDRIAESQREFMANPLPT